MSVTPAAATPAATDIYPDARLTPDEAIEVEAALNDLAFTGKATINPAIAAKIANVKNDPHAALQRIALLAGQGPESYITAQIHAIATEALKV